MKRLIAMLLAVLILFSIAACSDGGTEPGGAETPAPEYADEAFGCSAWLCYWDAETALREAREHADSFESLVCFEAFFDAEGNILRDAAAVSPGDRVHIRMDHGGLHCRVEQRTEEEK